MTYRRHAFRAMGTEVTLLGPGGAPRFPAAAQAVEMAFARQEDRFSRFRGNSELARVNAAAGWWTTVSEGFEDLVRLALRQADRTDGLFDPTVLSAVIAAGYDRDFDEVLAGARGALHPAQPCGRWRDIGVRPGAVRLPEGVGLDFGGIAKGATADLAAGVALERGLPWALVSAGGDLRIAGDAPPIEVAIEDPGDPGTHAATVRIAEGALATSSVTSRAWGEGLHHVIDPRTGAPARTRSLQATVWAPSCAEAEALATWALLTGPAATATIPCAVATEDGDLHMSFPREVAA
jgi:thiamine biosynthesis lipoprotein